MESSLAVRLVVPGELVYRDLAIRTIAEASRLVSRRRLAGANGGTRGESTAQNLDLTDPFDAELVSAFSEIFNNIAMHAYQAEAGTIEIRLGLAPDHLEIEITDRGHSFDIASVPPPDALPEHGMGIHLARMMLDELHYEPGPPNVWRLIKYAQQDDGPSASDAPDPDGSQELDEQVTPS